jgi:hypothetical protein
MTAVGRWWNDHANNHFSRVDKMGRSAKGIGWSPITPQHGADDFDKEDSDVGLARRAFVDGANSS